MPIPKLNEKIDFNTAINDALIEKYNKDVKSVANQFVKVITGESATLETESAEARREKKEIEKGKEKGKKFFGLFDNETVIDDSEKLSYTEDEMKKMLQASFKKGYEQAMNDFKAEMDREPVQFLDSDVDYLDDEVNGLIVQDSLYDAESWF
jgi:hypothetical protein